MAKKNQQFNETKIFTDYQALAQATIPEIVANLPNQKIGYHNDEVKQYLAHAGQTAIKPQQFNWMKNIFLTIVNSFNLLLIVIFGFQLGTFLLKIFMIHYL
ncbi:hypothetical protein [Spiroplasma endosymbiont of Ammophila pubescens]|uniref:hypothetical protein n=1 Tax=Spiroplasma endosymbiont of Ammophila pubescens TaxID=3066315 RepID=UPI0032B2A44B